MTGLPLRPKLIGDLRTARGRLAVMSVAIAIGAAVVTALLVTYVMMTRQVSANYLGTHPAAAQLLLPRVDAGLVEAVRQRPDIAAAEAGATVNARVEVAAGEWLPLLLFVVPDFSQWQLNTVRPQQGAWPPPEDGLLIERAALPLLQRQIGDRVQVQRGQGVPHPLRIAGTVHDPALAPAWQEHMAYGYISRSAWTALGEQPDSEVLKIAVREQPLEVAAIEQTAADLARWLRQTGLPAGEIRVPPPGLHPHQPQMSAVLRMLAIFGGLALLLASVLTATLVGGLLAQQRREIGILRAIGASNGQIARHYALLVGGVGVMAAVLGQAVGFAAAHALVYWIAGRFNLELLEIGFPAWILIANALLCVVLPLLAALLPIANAVRQPVREVLADTGGSRPGAGQSVERLLVRVRLAYAPLALAVRNSFRRRGRLVLVAALLAVGGAVFIASLNLVVGWEKLIADAAATRRYDTEIRLREAAPVAKVQQVAAAAGARRAEIWNVRGAAPARADGLNLVRTYPDGGHGLLVIRSLPADTALFVHEMLQGRWLQAADETGVVLNQGAWQRFFAGVAVGGEVSLLVNQQVQRFRLLGVVREPLAGAAAYVTPEVFGRISGRAGTGVSVRLVLGAGEPGGMRLQSVEQAFETAGLPVKWTQTEREVRRGARGHVYMLVAVLLVIALAMASVGLLGLAAALSAGILERLREFGVLRAIGASDAAIRITVVGEAISAVLVSVLLAVPLSWPLSKLIGNIIGEISAQPLEVGLAVGPVAAWLAVVLLGALAAGLVPAQRAVRLNVRECMA